MKRSSNHSRTVGLLILGLSVLLWLTACNDPSDSRAVWREAINKCASSDILGPDIVVFDPSNVLGPGTIFHRFADGGAQPSHLVTEYESDPASFMAPVGKVTCDVNNAKTMDLGGKLNFDTALSSAGANASAEVAADLKKARSIVVTADQIQWDQLVTGPFRERILHLPDGDAVKSDLLIGHDVVLSRALRVHGMTADLKFDSDVGTKLKGEAPNVVMGLPSGSSTVELNGTWTSNTTLRLKAAQDFYIAGELRSFSVEGLAGPSEEIGPKVEDAGKLNVSFKQ